MPGCSLSNPVWNPVPVFLEEGSGASAHEGATAQATLGSSALRLQHLPAPGAGGRGVRLLLWPSRTQAHLASQRKFLRWRLECRDPGQRDISPLQAMALFTPGCSLLGASYPFCLLNLPAYGLMGKALGFILIVEWENKQTNKQEERSDITAHAAPNGQRRETAQRIV